MGSYKSTELNESPESSVQSPNCIHFPCGPQGSNQYGACGNQYYGLNNSLNSGYGNNELIHGGLSAPFQNFNGPQMLMNPQSHGIYGDYPDLNGINYGVNSNFFASGFNEHYPHGIHGSSQFLSAPNFHSNFYPSHFQENFAAPHNFGSFAHELPNQHNFGSFNNNNGYGDMNSGLNNVFHAKASAPLIPNSNFNEIGHMGNMNSGRGYY